MSNTQYHFWRIIAFSALCATLIILTGCGGGDSEEETTSHIPTTPVICQNGACK